MRSLIAVSVLTALSGTAAAHQCDINVDGTLKIEDSVLTVTTDKRDTITIDADHRLYFNDDEISLDGEQQVWVTDYYQGINAAVPKVAEIAHEGINLAAEAIEQVFGELLGVDSSAVTDLTYKLQEIGQEVQYNFYADDGSIRLNTDDFDNGNFLGEEWENEFEEAVEDAVMSSIGSLMVTIGTEMIMSGGDMDSFEERMENFAGDIEQRMESRGQALEEKADSLCYDLVKVNAAEDSLQSSFDELSGLNVFQVEDHSESM